MAADKVITESPTPAQQAEPIEIGLLTRTKFGVVRAFLWAWARCFSLKGLYLFGKFFGTCEWLINYKRRRRFCQHLNRIFGVDYNSLSQSTIRKACRDHFTRTRCDKLFYLIFDKLPRAKILNRIKFHGRDILDEALKRNKGAYICMSHTGSYPVAILLMALMGYKVAGVRDPHEGNLRRYVQIKYEKTFPEFRAIRMFFSDAYPRDIYRCFQDGYVLGSALDIARHRGPHLRTAKATLFGREREFLTGPVQIGLRCGAPILQGFVISRKNFYFRLVVMGPLTDPDTELDEPEILNDLMQHYADNIAAHLTEHPDHISKS
ncbi:MAG: lysophospholipid acyltransferase family protein [Planctomycetota bacterium]|jgi:lauroyl/myristoyl acyltransferase